MKEGWTYKKLGEIATDMYRGSGIKRDQVTKEGMPCVRYGEIYTTYNIGFDKCFSHTDLSQISSPKYFEHGDLLFAITGESVEDIGKTIAYLGHEKCLSGGDIVVLKHNQDPKYLSYALSAPNAIKQKGLGKTKLKVVHTNIPALKEILIPIPSLDEQQRIVSRLDAAFAYIDELKANAEKQLSEARTLFQKALTKAMEPKVGWEAKKIKDISLLITKGSSPKWQGNSYVNSGGILFVTSENVREGYLEFNPAKYVDNSFNIKQRRSILKKNDVLVNIVGASIGRAAVFDIDGENANINQAVCLIRLDKNKLLPQYLCLFLNSEHAFNQYASMIKDTARANLSLDNIGCLEIGVPSLSEQQRIVSRLDAVSTHIRELEEVLQKTIAECDALKQALLRKVFE